ncbi:MAG: sensor histidine kinase [Candidatus Dormibacteria bacterium]
MAERASGGDTTSGSLLLQELEELTDAEKALLRRRMHDVVDRSERHVAPSALDPTAHPAPAEHPAPALSVVGPEPEGSPADPTLTAGRPDPATADSALLIRPRPGVAGVQSMLQALSTKALELLGADICQVFLDSGDLLVLEAEAPHGPPLQGVARDVPARLAPEEGFIAMVRAAGRAMTVAASELGDGPEREWITRGAVSVAAVPVGARGGAGSGMLVALRVTARTFSQGDLVEMARLADEVTLAMASADLLSRAEELAVLRERMNLAREIHDGLASDLSAVVQMFKYHEHRRRVDPTDADALLVQMRELVEAALQSARDILTALRPRQQTPRHLAENIKKQVESFSRTYGISGSTRILGDDQTLVAEEREAIHQVIRESLANIRKHSQCTRIEVLLDTTTRPFVLVVEDDGVGIDLQLASDKADSFGLLGMRERAQLLGGTLHVGNGPMGGVRLEFHGPAIALGA